MTKKELNQLWTDPNTTYAQITWALREFLAGVTGMTDEKRQAVTRYLSAGIRARKIQTPVLTNAVYRAIRDYDSGRSLRIPQAWNPKAAEPPKPEPIPDSYPSFACGSHFISIDQMPSRIRKYVRPILDGVSIETLAATWSTTPKEVLETLANYRRAVQSRLDNAQ